MKLKKLLKNVNFLSFEGKDVNIKNITDDSRKVTPSSLFIARKGISIDSHNFIKDAINNGAVAIVSEKNIDSLDIKLNNKVSFIQVKDSRKVTAIVASNWYSNPEKKLKLIAVTGTDGKTTTVNLIYHLIKNKFKTGLISTINAKINGKNIDTGFHVTNPDSLNLFKLLYKMTKAGCTHAVLEVTSHGLAQHRVYGLKFDISVLTNITHEHLDYHKTFKNYLKAKTLLFKRSKVIVLNKDDKHYSYIINNSTSQKTILYSIKNNAEYRAQNIIFDNDKTIFTVSFGKTKFEVKSNLLADYNVSNTLAAIAVSYELGINKSQILDRIKSFRPLTGRMEIIKSNKPFTIIVDFAHTPNALEKCLSYLKSISRSKLICVFGSAGLRDIQKRFLMGKVAGKYADMSVITAEDPRTEKVDDISKEIEKGLLTNKEITEKKHNYTLIQDRGEAIYWAINKCATKDDIIVICGKGHEKSMCYGNIEYPFSDQKAAKMAINGKILNIQIR